MNELLKSKTVGNCSSVEEIIKMWSDTGLLDGLNKQMSKKVAIAMENCAKFLLSKEFPYIESTTNPFVDTVIFPVIRRCMSEIAKTGANKTTSLKWCKAETAKAVQKKLLNDFDVKLVYKMLCENWDGLTKIIENLYGADYKNIDIEAETCAHLSDMITYVLCHNAMRQYKLEMELKNGE